MMRNGRLALDHLRGPTRTFRHLRTTSFLQYRGLCHTWVHLATDTWCPFGATGARGTISVVTDRGNEPLQDPLEQRVVAALDALAASYTLLDCDPELADTAAFCEHYGWPLDRSANTIVVASRKPPDHYAACLVLADTRLDVNNRVRRLMGVRKASFAPAETTAELTGMVMGGVTAFGLPPGFPLYVDSRIMVPDWVIVGGGSRSMKLRVDPEVFGRMPDTEVVTDLATS